MTITDDMVQRALETAGPVNCDLALYEALHRLSDDHKRRIVRNALTAALGDVEPLEDVRREFRRIDREHGREKAAYFAYGAAKALRTTVYEVLQLAFDDAVTSALANAKGGK